MWQHIIPRNDIIEHTTDDSNSWSCVCAPRVDIDNMLIIHHAMDCRDSFVQIADNGDTDGTDNMDNR